MLLGVGLDVRSGAHIYRGYWSLAKVNWPGFIIILPLSLYVLRQVMRRVAPIQDGETPVIVGIFSADQARTERLQELREHLLAPGVLWTAVLLVAGGHVADLWDVGGVYLSALKSPSFGSIDPLEKDWTVMFVAGGTSLAANLAMVVIGYTVQFCAFTLLALVAIWLFLHNLLFLRWIYQRRWSPPGEEERYLVIELEDAEQCFGFRRAHEAFNTQVGCLVVLGAMMWVSRFVNVTGEQSEVIYGGITSVAKLVKLDGDALEALGRALSARDLFPDVGQWLIALSWVAMFLLVSMPAGVKMLPRLGGRAVERSIVGYLKEFLPDRIWKYGDVPSVEEINEIAGRFAANAFWPTGNSQAWWLFFFSTATFFVILFPLRFSAQHVVKFVAFYVFLAALAVAVTGAMFRALTLYVGYVDERLVGRGLEKSKG
jgi:hypothetical protein